MAESSDEATNTGAQGAAPTARGALAWLAAGAAAGLLLAAVSLISGGLDGTDTLPSGTVARVNDVVIRVEEYERLLAGLASDSRQPLDAERRRHVLDRMIEEELLVQRALELGLAAVDRRVRAELTNSLIASVVGGVEDELPSEEELREFYAENAGFFSGPGRLRVRQIYFRVPTPADEDLARSRASEAARRLAAGEPFEAVRAELGDAEVSPVPDAPLPPAKLREYLGPTALRAAAELEVGRISEPVRSGVGFHVLEVVDRIPASTPAFESIRAQVENEWRRRAGDRALRAYLDGLRDRAHVVTSSTAP